MAATHAVPTGYVASWAVMILLTLIAFLAVGMGWFPEKTLMLFVLALAVVQVVVQLWLFMHLNVGRGWYIAFFAMGLGFAAIWAYTVWYLPWSVG